MLITEVVEHLVNIYKVKVEYQQRGGMIKLPWLLDDSGGFGKVYIMALYVYDKNGYRELTFDELTKKIFENKHSMELRNP